MLISSSLLYLAAVLHLGGGVAHRSRMSRTAAATPPAAADVDSTRACEAAELELRRTALRALIQSAPDRLPALLDQLKKRSNACGAPLRLELLTQDYGPSGNGVIRVGGQPGGPTQIMTANPDRGAPRNGQPDSVNLRIRFARDLAATDPDTAVRRVAIAILGSDSEPAGCEALAAAVRTAPTATLRDAALSTMIGTHHPHSAPMLRALYPSLRDQSTKIGVLNAVAQADTLAWSWLLGVASASNESYDVRQQALGMALARAQNAPSGAPAGRAIPTTKALGEAYGKLPESALRHQIVAVLSQRTQEDAAAEQLARVAKTDPDMSLRQQAVVGLQGSQSQRAAPLLAEIAAQ